MSHFTGDMWLYPPEPIAGSPNTSVTPRLGQLPPYPCLQSILLERSSIPTRNCLAVSKHFESDVEYIFWDAYDKMAPVEHRKEISDHQLCQRDGSGLESRHRVRNHAFGSQHQGNARFEETHRLGGHSGPINVQHPALGLPSMELFEDSVPGPCSSDHYCVIEPSKDRQAGVPAESFGESEMLLQPEETPVSHEALMSKDKTIYAGLEPVEARCVDIGIPEHDATTEEYVSEALNIEYSRNILLNGLQEKPPCDPHELLVDTQHLADTSIPKRILGRQKTSPTCEPSIASKFGDLGVVLAFIIIQFFGQDGWPTNTEKETRNAIEIRKRIDLENDPWQSLTAMNSQLLHKHHDYSLAFNHPAKSRDLKNFAAKYYETLLAFEESWTEFLGGLRSIQMPLDDPELSSQKTWSDFARSWYNNATDSSHRICRPWVNDCTNYLHEKPNDRLETHISKILGSETDRRCPAKSKKPQTARARERRLHAARLENADQHPLSPAAVKNRGPYYSKDHISVNIRPLSPMTRSLKDLERSKRCISVHTKDLGLSPRSFSTFVGFPPNAHSTTLPAPVPCTQSKTAWTISRSLRSYRCIRPCHVLMALGFITIVGSLAPAIWRSTKQNDISGGFSLGQYILGAGVFVIGSIVVIHSKTCTCWE